MFFAHQCPQNNQVTAQAQSKKGKQRRFEYLAQSQKMNRVLQQELEDCKQSKAELENLLNSLLDLNPLPIAVTSTENDQVLFKNQHFKPLFGMKSGEILDKIGVDFYANPSDHAQLLDKLQNGESLIKDEVRLKRTNGEIFEALVWARTVYYNSQPATLWILEEITEPKHSQQMNARDITAQKATTLRESEEWFRAIAESTPVPMAISCMADGTILYANPQVEKTFGLTPEEMLGSKTLDFYYKSADRQSLLEQLTRDGYIYNYEVQAKRANGTPFWMTVSLRALTFNGEPALLSVFYDITERKQALADLRTSARQQAAVAELGQQALAGTDLAVLMQQATNLLAQTLEVDYCGVWELMTGGSALLLTAGIGWQNELVGSAIVGTGANSQLAGTLLTGQPVIVEDFRIETRFSGPPLLHNHRVVSGISVVIPGANQPFGILGAYTTQERTFSQDDIHFLQAIANVLAAAIERKQSEARLHLMERAIAASSNGVVITDANQPDNPMIYVNPAFETMTGYRKSEVIGRNSRFLQGLDADQPGVHELRAAIQAQQECHVTLRNYRQDGTLFWNELYVAPVYDAEGYLTHFVGIQTDITERKRAEEALLQQEEQYRRIVETATEGIWVLNQDNETSFVNQQMATMLGYKIDEMLGKTLFAFMDEEGLVIANAYLERRRQGIQEAHDFKFRRQDGSDLWAIVSTAPLFDQQGQYAGVLGMLTDITDRKRMEKQLVHDACYDALTGLPNRVLFMNRLQQALDRRERCPDDLFAVLFLDLDRFKVVNDSLGHMVGDQLLVAIAQRLQACMRPGDTVARLGGDEFTILLDQIKNVSDATSVAQSIHQALKSPLNLNGYEIFTTVSLGIALSVTGYDRPEDMLRDADTAMYSAKEQGKACHTVFAPIMYDRAVALLQLETDLRWALERQELRVYYQPIVSLTTGRITGFEALVRWQHPERGLISPYEFIPVAEETGLIVPIGQWVLRSACKQLRQWQAQFPSEKPLTISVNLSGEQFSQPDLAEQVAQILQETELALGSLKLEITESGMLQNAEGAAAVLEQLKALNVRLCIDDFGTGYSSLSRLRQFPIDTLKIDRSFVSGMSEVENALVVQTIVTLSHNLGMDVVAEGVETQEQLAQIKRLQCEYGQGYFFSKPLNSKAAEVLMAAEPRW